MMILINVTISDKIANVKCKHNSLKTVENDTEIESYNEWTAQTKFTEHTKYELIDYTKASLGHAKDYYRKLC